MNIKFIVNDYALIWSLLFQASISETIYNLKQKLWSTYKKEYNITYKDKEAIIKDPKNFIPTDDTIYNIILEDKGYEKLKKKVERYRIGIMKLWDKNRKTTDNLFKNIIRKDLSNYYALVVHEELNIISHPEDGRLIIGKAIDNKNPLKILLDINMEIVMNNLKEYKGEDRLLKKSIVELAVINEYGTKLSKKSCYSEGTTELATLKTCLYPYWLMYLGIAKEEFNDYMNRDKIVFDADKYAYEKELKKMNLEEFIDFCIRNKRYIIRNISEEKK